MLRNRPLQIVVMTVVIASMMMAFTIAAPDEAPATAPQTAQAQVPAAAPAAPPKPAEVAPDAAPLVEKLAGAYKNLKSLQLAGSLAGDFDVDGQKEQQKVELTSAYAAPNQFRHAMKDDFLVGSTGEQFFVYESGRKLYKTSEAKKEKVAMRDLPQPFGQLLLDQNTSLALALSPDPAAELKNHYQKIAKAADVQIDGKAYPALSLTNDHETVTLALDPQTSLVRRATFDIASALKQRGAKDVNKATLTLDYSATTPDAATKPEQFAWAPPAGARDVATLQQEGPGGGEIAAMQMVGKPAPDFTIKDLGGKDVKFADLKGNVLVLDFWATWCPPCVAGMPVLNELAGEMKDRGLKVLAVNEQEEKELVQGFVNSRKLENLLVVLDTDAKVATDFQATDVLPTTIVVGKDGTIRKVIAGGGPQAEKDLRAAVEEALKATK